MRIQWLNCWDALRVQIQAKNSWGKQELLRLMEEIERAEIRRASHASEEDAAEQKNG